MPRELPDDSEERQEWLIGRGAELDAARDSMWVAAELDYLWDNPDEYENGESYEIPDDADQEAYALFRLGFVSGVEYEHQYPRNGRTVVSYLQGLGLGLAGGAGLATAWGDGAILTMAVIGVILVVGAYLNEMGVLA